MELRMLKKYATLVIVGLLVILFLTAFRTVGIRPVINNAFGIAQNGFHSSLSSDIVPSLGARLVVSQRYENGYASVAACLLDDNNARFAHLYNGIYIPPMDATSSLAPTTLACFASDAGSNFRLAHVWNGIYIPSMDVTG
jgi:hypothetical protein